MPAPLAIVSQKLLLYFAFYHEHYSELKEAYCVPQTFLYQHKALSTLHWYTVVSFDHYVCFWKQKHACSQ